ncbi:MAG: VOC family protein [Armatimonadota bacterium]
MQKITPFLWFDDKAEDAMNFYVSVFRNAKVVTITRYGSAGPGAEGTVMTAEFQLEGLDFVALNGGPVFTFTPAISFVINCESQEEVDHYWDRLSEGGEQIECGWLTDKFGVSWQVVPTILFELMNDPDSVKSQRVMAAMLKMKKLDIAGLKRAYEQE